MRNMRILIDTNVLIDYLLQREPFLEAATQILDLCEEKKLHGCIAAHSIPNMSYILRKDFSPNRLRELLLSFCLALNVVDIDRYKIVTALEQESFHDFEDCLQMQCAASYHANYIISRNCKDFTGSTIPAIEPDEFLALFGKKD